MTTLREAAQQALDFIRWSQFVPCQSEPFPEPPSTAPQVEAALKAALAEPVHEPVYWEVRCTAHPKWMRVDEQQFDEYVANGWGGQRLYTSPPQRKPLTEEEIYSLFRTVASPVMFARAVERAHGIT